MPEEEPSCTPQKHRWSKWTATKIIIATHSGLPMGDKAEPMDYQRRTCLDCQLIQTQDMWRKREDG